MMWQMPCSSRTGPWLEGFCLQHLKVLLHIGHPSISMHSGCGSSSSSDLTGCAASLNGRLPAQQQPQGDGSSSSSAD